MGVFSLLMCAHQIHLHSCEHGYLFWFFFLSSFLTYESQHLNVFNQDSSLLLQEIEILLYSIQWISKKFIISTILYLHLFHYSMNQKIAVRFTLHWYLCMIYSMNNCSSSANNNQNEIKNNNIFILVCIRNVLI